MLDVSAALHNTSSCQRWFVSTQIVATALLPANDKSPASDESATVSTIPRAERHAQAQARKMHRRFDFISSVQVLWF
jgi:hypothetical protein